MKYLLKNLTGKNFAIYLENDHGASTPLSSPAPQELLFTKKYFNNYNLYVQSVFVNRSLFHAATEQE